MPANVSIGARSQVAYTEESSWGITPGSPTMRVVRITGGSLNAGRSLLESAELIADRSAPSPIQGTPFPGMTLNVEMQAKALGTLIKHMVTDTTSVHLAESLAGTVDISSGANVDTLILVVEDLTQVTTVTFSGTDPIDASTIAAQINTAHGTNIASVNASDNLYLYTSVTTATGFVRVYGNSVSSTAALTALGYPANGKYSWNFTQLRASRDLPEGLSIEVGFTDVELYTVFNGSKVNSLSVDISPNSIVTGSFEIVSKGGGEDYTSSPLDATPTEDFSDKFDAFTGQLLIDGVNESRLRSLSFNITNNMVTDFQTVYQKERDAIPDGGRDLTGSMTVKFDNLDFINRAKNFTESSLSVKMENVADNRFLRVTFPALRIQLPSFDIPEGPVDLPVDFIAHKDAVENTDLIVDVGSGEAV